MTTICYLECRGLIDVEVVALSEEGQAVIATPADKNALQDGVPLISATHLGGDRFKLTRDGVSVAVDIAPQELNAKMLCGKTVDAIKRLLSVDIKKIAIIELWDVQCKLDVYSRNGADWERNTSYRGSIHDCFWTAKESKPKAVAFVVHRDDGCYLYDIAIGDINVSATVYEHDEGNMNLEGDTDVFDDKVKMTLHIINKKVVEV